MIDKTDISILTLLQHDARVSNAEIARRVGMAPSAILERIRKLEERGIIQGYSVILDPVKLGYGLLAYIQVRTDGGGWHRDIAEKLACFPEIQEVHHIAGEDCFLVKVRARDTESLGRLLRDRVGVLPAIYSTRTTIVLDSVKESGTLPLDGANGGDSK